MKIQKKNMSSGIPVERPSWMRFNRKNLQEKVACVRHKRDVFLFFLS